MASTKLEYAGFWVRVGASLIDTILLGMITWPILMAVYGPSYWVSTDFIKGPVDFLVSWVRPASAVIAFWIYRQAAPGKMAISAQIVDAEMGRPPSARQLVVRYFGNSFQ